MMTMKPTALEEGMMTRIPGTQSRAVMNEKERQVRELLNRGLTITQVTEQMHCSRGFVKRIRKEMSQGINKLPAT
jgi:hypothetical protein